MHISVGNFLKWMNLPKKARVLKSPSVSVLFEDAHYFANLVLLMVVKVNEVWVVSFSILPQHGTTPFWGKTWVTKMGVTSLDWVLFWKKMGTSICKLTVFIIFFITKNKANLIGKECYVLVLISFPSKINIILIWCISQ